MTKPRKKQKKAMYDWHECVDHIEKKYKKDLRNYAGKRYDGSKNDPEYLDFWHWVIGDRGVNNGSELHFDPKQTLHEQKLAKKEGTLDDFYEYAPAWVCEICELFVKEFPDCGDEPFWCEW